MQSFVCRIFRIEAAGARFHLYVSHPYDDGVFEPSLQLMDYMQRISQMLWDRATGSRDHAQILEAVHRVGNFNSWGDMVRAAAEWKIQEDVGLPSETDSSIAVVVNREAVLEVARASRGLVSWLLSEDRKRKLDQIGVEQWDFGEGMTDPGSRRREGNDSCE